MERLLFHMKGLSLAPERFRELQRLYGLSAKFSSSGNADAIFKYKAQNCDSWTGFPGRSPRWTNVESFFSCCIENIWFSLPIMKSKLSIIKRPTTMVVQIVFRFHGTALRDLY